MGELKRVREVRKVSHDIGYVRYPESYSRSFRYFYRSAPRFFLRKSRSILTVSEFSKTELTSYYGIDRQRILVVPNAAGTSSGRQPVRTLFRITGHRFSPSILAEFLIRKLR